MTALSLLVQKPVKISPDHGGAILHGHPAPPARSKIKSGVTKGGCMSRGAATSSGMAAPTPISGHA